MYIAFCSALQVLIAFVFAHFALCIQISLNFHCSRVHMCILCEAYVQFDFKIFYGETFFSTRIKG